MASEAKHIDMVPGHRLCRGIAPYYDGPPPDNKYIPIDQLRCVRGLILDRTNEACGILRPSFDNRLSVFVDRFGPQGSRGICTPARHTKWIWHTHPHTSKSYPSWQDIAKTLKPHKGTGGYLTDYPYYSIVFTFWGIWTIKCFAHKRKFGEKTTMAIKKMLDYCVIPLYKKTKGKEPLDSQQLVNNFTECVNRQISKINATFGIKFIPWDRVPDYGYEIK